jgi:hypothetical protein
VCPQGELGGFDASVRLDATPASLASRDPSMRTAQFLIRLLFLFESPLIHEANTQPGRRKKG